MGRYLSGMWIYRLGLTRTKLHALTGRPLSGREAADVGLINEAVPFAELEATVAALAAELAAIPSSQLAAMKLIVNQAYENMGLASTQTLGPILDGLMRNTPEARDVHRAGGRAGACGPWWRSATGRSGTTARVVRGGGRIRAECRSSPEATRRARSTLSTPIPW